MGSHDSFGHLKLKLWPKEWSRVKLAIWLVTTESQESTWFPCVQVACDIPLERSWRGLQVCFKLHLNPRSAHKVMGPQVAGVPTLGIWDSHLGVLEQNVIWMWASWRGTEYTIRREVVASSKSGPLWMCVRVCPWLVLAWKVLKLCTNQLVVWFV
jgi:hypothetical protein